MPQIKVKNFSQLNLKESSTLSGAVSPAATTLPLISTQGMAINDILIVGMRGTETSEKLVIASLTDTSVVVATGIKYKHSEFDQVMSLNYDSVKLWRAANVDGTTPTDGSFVSISTTVIDPDQPETIINDSTGGSDYWYKSTYLNSITNAETSLASSTPKRGGGYGAYCSTEEIRTNAGFLNNQHIADADIDRERLAAQDLINSKLSGVYTVPFVTPIPAMINRITILLAAAFLLKRDYGALNTLTTNNGRAKETEAMDYLNRLESKELVLIDTSGNNTSIQGGGSGVSGYPNTTIEPMFSVDDRY